MNRKKKLHTCEECGRSFRRNQCPYCRREQQWEEHEKHKFSITPRIDAELHKYTYPVVEYKSGLYIWGKVRTGKTLLAIYLLYTKLRNNFIENIFESHAFAVTEDLLQEIRNSYNKKEGTRSEQEILDFYSNVDILVLDDIGVRPTNDWSYTILYQIINNRYEKYKTTIFTSNCSIKQLSHKMGDHRVVRRIEDMVDKTLHV